MDKVHRYTAVIGIDEAPMSYKSVYEAMDFTLQDVMRVKQPMWGIPARLCGDFRFSL